MTVTSSVAPMGDVKAQRIGTIAFAGTIGTIVEWYDFIIYGTAAALVFNKEFFPNVDPRIGTLADIDILVTDQVPSAAITALCRAHDVEVVETGGPRESDQEG